jgi:hypothetical protein
VKRKMNVPKKAFITEQVNVILQCKLPLKYKDPACPSITCMIGVSQIERALLDLGASVDLLPYSVYLQLGLGELKPTSMTLQLADRSVKIPRGIAKDVLIKVDVVQIKCTRKCTSHVQYNGVQVGGRTHRELYS